MLVGIDVVFDFPSQHEGKKSLSSHSGIFFSTQAERLWIDKFWPKPYHSEEAPPFCTMSEISLHGTSLKPKNNCLGPPMATSTTSKCLE